MRFFGIYFIIEIVLLVVAGRFLGVGLTLLIILTTTIFGILILRLAGISTLINIRQKVNQGETPDGVMMNGMLLGLGGGLLFLPGLLGNVIGVLLVIPASRTLFMEYARKILVKYSRQQQTTYGSSNPSQGHKPDVLEGEWERKDK